MIKQRDYTKAVNKIAVTGALFDSRGCERIVGLAGPNPVECVARWKAAGFTHITVYEHDIDVFTLQDRLLSKAHPDVNLVKGDILDSFPMENVMYDVDLCCPINQARNLDKFKIGIFTFCLRPGRGHKGENREWVERRFVEMRGETFEAGNDMQDDETASKTLIREITTEEGSVYHSAVYKDIDSPPMLVIKTVK